MRRTATPHRRRGNALTTALLLASTVVAIPTASAAPPAHDDFANARVIPSLPYTNTTNTTEATTAGDDPNCGGLGNARSVWYNFTATSDVVLRVNTSGSDYETVMGIFRGPRGAFTSQACANDPVGPGVSHVALSVPAGTTVHIMIAARAGGAGGNLTIHAAAGPAPTPPAPPAPPAPVVLTAKIASPIGFKANRASVAGVGELDRSATGKLCVHARLSQPTSTSTTSGSAYKCFPVDDTASVAWSLDVRGSRNWRAGGGTVSVTAHFIAPGLADVDTRSRGVSLVAT